jgi:hypothetical protein
MGLIFQELSLQSGNLSRQWPLKSFQDVPTSGPLKYAARGMMALAAKYTSAIREAMSFASPVSGSTMNENWNFGARERFDAGTRFAHAGKALLVHHLYLANN